MPYSNNRTSQPIFHAGKLNVSPSSTFSEKEKCTKTSPRFQIGSKPDLILLDVMMPDIDGYETCAELKRDLNTAHIPIVSMTALSETPEKVKAFELGAFDYITRPFERAELLARVATCRN